MIDNRQPQVETSLREDCRNAQATSNTQVFINYRGTDEPYAAALIDHVLSARFGSDRVFRASKSIRPGDNFDVELLRNLRRPSVLLAVIGCRWLVPTITQRQERSELLVEGDWVHREISEAFRYRIPVVPVLVGTVSLPATAEIPAIIAPLAVSQYLRLRYRESTKDLTRLGDEIAALPGTDNG
jgi:hypothetical protein